MDLRPYRLTPIPGAVSINFSEDFRVEVGFCDSSTGELLHDFTGDKALKVSDMLSAMPPEVIEAFVQEIALSLVKISQGVS